MTVVPHAAREQKAVGTQTALTQKNRAVPLVRSRIPSWDKPALFLQPQVIPTTGPRSDSVFMTETNQLASCDCSDLGVRPVDRFREWPLRVLLLLVVHKPRDP